MIAPLKKANFQNINLDVLFPEHDLLFALSNEGTADYDELVHVVKQEAKFLKEMLLKHGGLYFRGFNLTASQFKEMADLLSPTNSLKYIGGIAPRPEFTKDIALATVMPEAALIQQHHEMSYQPVWPMKILFYCDIASPVGGETPICSTRHFMKLLPKHIIENFETRQVKNIIRYRSIKNVFPTWQDAFKTEDTHVVEEFCRQNGMEFKWIDNGLETSIISQGLAAHPETHEKLWHNHAHLFWNSPDRSHKAPNLRTLGPGLPPQVYQYLQSLPLDQLPTDVTYGDGGAIEKDVIEIIHQTLEDQKKSFEWKHGDFVCLDNMLTFHGRNSFEGNRRILAILKEEYRSPLLKLAK